MDMSSNIIHLDTDNFDLIVAAASKPLLVDFWAQWCGPCKLMNPVLEELASEMSGKLQVCKVDIERNPEIARRFHIMSIPTLILFKDGRAVQQVVGRREKGELTALLSENL